MAMAMAMATETLVWRKDGAIYIANHEGVAMQVEKQSGIWRFRVGANLLSGFAAFMIGAADSLQSAKYQAEIRGREWDSRRAAAELVLSVKEWE